MSCEIVIEEERITVLLAGLVTVKEATGLRERLFPLLLQGIAGLTFDLGGVTGMDSSGFGLLLAAQSIASERRIGIAFVRADGDLRARCLQAGIRL